MKSAEFTKDKDLTALQEYFIDLLPANAKTQLKQDYLDSDREIRMFEGLGNRARLVERLASIGLLTAAGYRSMMGQIQGQANGPIERAFTGPRPVRPHYVDLIAHSRLRRRLRF